jgi:putative phosphoesterase
MNIAIISDIHDNLPNLQKVLDYCAKNSVEKLICCGDLATLETLDFLNDNFAGEIFFAFGNMDAGHIADYPFKGAHYKHTEIFPDFGHVEIAQKKLAFVHFPEVARQLCESGKYDFVFHGHTHKPWTQVLGKCTLLNPGNVANQMYAPTFAVWNTSDNSFILVRINELKS